MKIEKKLMAPGGIEPTTFALLARRSNQLNYGARMQQGNSKLETFTSKIHSEESNRGQGYPWRFFSYFFTRTKASGKCICILIVNQCLQCRLTRMVLLHNLGGYEMRL